MKIPIATTWQQHETNRQAIPNFDNTASRHLITTNISKPHIHRCSIKQTTFRFLSLDLLSIPKTQTGNFNNTLESRGISSKIMIVNKILYRDCAWMCTCWDINFIAGFMSGWWEFFIDNNIDDIVNLCVNYCTDCACVPALEDYRGFSVCETFCRKFASGLKLCKSFNTF